MINQLRFALAFLTLLPVANNLKFDSQDFSKSTKFFGYVGYVFASINFVCLFVLQDCFNHWVLALLIVVANILLQGGLHFDALMDSFDGIAVSNRSRKEILEVMKDSHCGAFAVMAFVIVLIAQLVLTSTMITLQPRLLLCLMTLMPVASRMLLSLVIFWQIKKEDIEASSSIASLRSDSNSILDSIFTIFAFMLLAISFIFYLRSNIAEIVEVIFFFFFWFIISWIIYFWLAKKLKGYNGDSLGAGLVLSETLFLMLEYLRYG